MKLEITRTEFLRAWQAAERSCGVKSTVPAATGILITADDDGVVLEATDFKTAVRCSASGVNIIEPGTAILPVKLLGEFLKKIATETAILEIKGERGTFEAGRTRTRFTTIPASEFPNIASSDGAAEFCLINAQDLIRIISEGSVASSQPSDFPKYLGTCLLKVSDGIITTAATDGKRLSLSKSACENSADGGSDALLPVQPLKELVRLLGACEPDAKIQILNDNSTVWFKLDGIEFSIRRVDAVFPNFERILSSEVLTTLKISREEILSALERIDIIAKNTISHLVVLHLSPDMGFKMTTRAQDFGTTVEEIEDVEITGNTLQVGFNAGYLQDGLKALQPGEIKIEFNGEEGQTRITQEDSDNFLYMLMPARFSPQDIMDDGGFSGQGDDMGSMEYMQNENPGNMENLENMENENMGNAGDFNPENSFDDNNQDEPKF